ncbi:heteromeric transposase endonuclease subunit TnsA [Paramaledivibacter caminithermalis]|jgi:hypothetical protein|uniref:TnsA endonuclease C terminal n=1 Tax=Paramaledivibacter caminithermalis (strain DSM 15212 / CIP 107654 / DViRD3) TaxID=1121301 RepID=A0A1M6SUV3_PARC5|nr:heteromeric transposase endonuclease subunit TnsA [Paramaledivibacter caminithermalis]SHK48511.1 TnsA endonuclease C terminal [Paramaledivibacter caminithermalis DSM 15212]
MAKRKREITKSRIEKLIKEGRGHGIGADYKPWILIQDVPSNGRATRLKGIKTSRQHEFLSDMERDYFYIIEYSDGIIDIREQFPLLPLEETVLIAKELGIEHPKDPKTGENVVMTTDFLITIKGKDGELIDKARTIKQKEELWNERVLEKFEIERKYWKRHDIDWGIVTEEEIDKTFAQNISYVHSYSDLSDIDSLKGLEEDVLADLIVEFLKRTIEQKHDIRKLTSQFDKDMFLEKGTGICIFKYLIINKIIKINLFTPIDINRKIEIEFEQDTLYKKVNAL